MRDHCTNMWGWQMSPLWPERRSRPGEGGSDLASQAGDQAKIYSGTSDKATASTPALELVYTRPAWMSEIERHPAPRSQSQSPPVCHFGNVAKVDWQPLGFGLIELAPGEFALAWRRPWKRRSKARCEPFAPQGGDRQAAEAELAKLVAVECRPVYPPLLLGDVA